MPKNPQNFGKTINFSLKILKFCRSASRGNGGGLGGSASPDKGGFANFFDDRGGFAWPPPLAMPDINEIIVSIA